MQLVRTAAATAVLAALLAAGAQARPERAACPSPRLDDPYRVAAQFLSTAVQRRNLRLSYRLATPSLRGSRSCAEWASGRLPVSAFRRIDWRRSAYQSVAGGDGQLVIRVLLYRPHEAKPVPFLMELQKEPAEPGWHVGWFGRDRWYTPAAKAQPKPALPAA
jgi:hypothetical protein